MKLVKVDRVHSEQEVEILQNLGVNAITVTLSSDSRFNDMRSIDKNRISSIKKIIRENTLFIGELSFENCFNFLDFVIDVKFDYIQLYSERNQTLPIKFCKQLKSKGIGFIYSSLEASYDTDPSWILRDIPDQLESNTDFFQVDLLPDVNDSWQFLKEKCPDFPDELQLSDINDLASKYSLLVTTDFSEENIEEIVASLQNIKGISFVLGNNPIRNDIHYFNYSEVLKILQKLTL
ncbi:hypothetical protein [Spirulina sp. 06S082]|uniref:hypothetical protein n=1 Tax=Spirulina sp. 06S082 TaxID=3110248 RepID=UPI002B21B47F|nr:hypothetical protein [Spirulina sp. 06S082]MEA5471826.1 hypothetical protein [Spirulina sp. 06S082]